MRFEVPQFIEVEDKIFGPFTWKQFIYLAGGGAIALISFLTLPFVFFVIIGGPFIALSVSLAFHRINNRPFSVFLESAIQYTINDKLYLWKKDITQTIKHTQIKPKSVVEPHNAPSSKENLALLSRRLELNTLEKQE